MKSFRQFVAEMAPARSKDLNAQYYHGTAFKKRIDGIIANGIQPPAIHMGKAEWGTDKIYVASSFDYAFEFAIGRIQAVRCVMDPNYIVEDSVEPYAYMCVIDGADIADLYPDAHYIGGLLETGAVDWLNELAEDVLDGDSFSVGLDVVDYEDEDSEYYVDGYDHSDYDDMTKDIPLIDAVRNGDQDAITTAGDILLPLLSDEQIYALIDLGSHIEHSGTIYPSQIWKLDKRLSAEILQDNSKFWELAERIV